MNSKNNRKRGDINLIVTFHNRHPVTELSHVLDNPRQVLARKTIGVFRPA